jgi:hypothetical protein
MTLNTVKVLLPFSIHFFAAWQYQPLSIKESAQAIETRKTSAYHWQCSHSKSCKGLVNFLTAGNHPGS